MAARHKQTPRAIERFWRVVLVSALDEELDRTDARFGIDVFWKAFSKTCKATAWAFRRYPLAELYEGCRVGHRKKSGEVVSALAVRSLCLKDGALTAVQFDGGREESADAFILAVPHDKLAELLPAEIRLANPALGQLEKFKVSPITGVHFWFDRQVTSEPFITLLDTQTQWIFNKTALYGAMDPGYPPSGWGQHAATQAATNFGQYLQLVISASYELLRKSREEIIELCLKEVRQALPAAREAQLVKATVIKEAAATFSPEPGVDPWRPRSNAKRPAFS
jgi:zeta-carotene desaturase